MNDSKKYHIANVQKFALLAFQDFKNQLWENAVKNVRSATEAICRVVLLHEKGEQDGNMILKGELDAISNHIRRPNKVRAPSLVDLIQICHKLRYFDKNRRDVNTKIYHRFDDLRKIGNKGAHVPNSAEQELSSREATYCLSLFKEILHWFYFKYLRQPIPAVVQASVEGEVEVALEEDYHHPTWDVFYEECEGFSRGQKFILIAPPKFPGLTKSQLGQLGRINWHLIFDFDPDSKESGLFASLSEELKGRPFRPITVEQRSLEKLISPANRSINYVFANGISSLPLSVAKSHRAWSRLHYDDFLKSLIKEYLSLKTELVTIVCLYDEVKFTRSIIQAFDAYISNAELIKVLLLVQNNVHLPQVAQEFEQLPGQVLELSVATLIEGIGKTIPPDPVNFKRKIYQVPGKDTMGEERLIDISEQYLSLVDRGCIPLYAGIAETSAERDLSSLPFYQGAPVTWSNISSGGVVERDKLADLIKVVDKYVKNTRKSYVIDLIHRPGSGGSTLARQAAFEFYQNYPTVLIEKYQGAKTGAALFELSGLTQRPIFAIVEAHQVSQNNLDRLVRQVNENKKHVVFLYVKRTFGKLPRSRGMLVGLSEKMVTIQERNRFIEKFTSVATGSNQHAVKQLRYRDLATCDIIDFSLSAFEAEYQADALDQYLLSYLNKLPTSQLKFAGFCSLLYHYTQKSISDLWLKNLFPQKSLAKELSQRPMTERYLAKLFLNELDEDFQETEYWRPKYNRFADEILSLAIAGLQINRKNSWKDQLHHWVIDLINGIRKSNDYLTDDIRQALKSLILERDHQDLLGLDESYEKISNRKFSQLLKDVSEKEKQDAIFSTLIKAYPDEAHFRGHYGRFLYEKAADELEFKKAEEQITLALELGEDDFNLWHIRGMCNRRRIEFLLRSNLDAYQAEELEDLEAIVRELTREVNAAFLKSRDINPYNLHSHTAQIQILIRVVEFGRRIRRQSKVSFLLDKRNSWYEERLEDIFDLMEEAQYNIDLSQDLERAKSMDRSRRMIRECQAKLYQFMGDFSRATDQFKKLSDSADRQYRPYYRKMYVYSTLAGKVNNDPNRFSQAWAKLSLHQSESLLAALLDNIREQPENPYHIKSWLQAVRYCKSFMSLEDCISIVKTWVDNSQDKEISNIEALYYCYVLNACMAIEAGDGFSLTAARLAGEYLKRSKMIAKNDRYSFEWYGRESGVNRMVSHQELGGMIDRHRFFSPDKERLLQRVEGTVTTISGQTSGNIKLACGLDCFFVPSHAKFERGRDETTRVSFYIGFRQIGLTAWKVERVNRKKDEVETTTEPIVDIDLEGREQEEIDHLWEADVEAEMKAEVDTNAAFTSAVEELNELSHRPDPEQQGLKVIDKIDLSQFDKYKRNNKN
ncbi:MAG: hypothetical protein AAF146_06720 [Bacteroidota bacterium]